MDQNQKFIVVQLIASHQTRLRALVRCLFVRSADVDDLVQEINCVLWEKSDSFQPGTDFWSWASQIARFKALNQIRKYDRERLVFDDEMLARIASVAEQRVATIDQRRDALGDCLKSLPTSQRQLIDLRYASGNTIEVIADSINRPAGSVRQTLYRIRESLQKCIEGKLATGGDA